MRGIVMYVDVFAAGIGQWYEFKCEEEAVVRDIINEMYLSIKYIEKQKNEIEESFHMKSAGIEGVAEYKIDQDEQELYRRELNLVCIDKGRILNKNVKLKECNVENGNRLILI